MAIRMFAINLYIKAKSCIIIGYNRVCHCDQDLSNAQRVLISHQWFKSYGYFTEGVDFAYWWSISGGGSAINGATPSSLNVIPQKSIGKEDVQYWVLS